jgi:voltage-gated potassium channel
VFDRILILTIIASVLVVIIDSIRPAHTLYLLEWAFTILFTVEYLVRVWVAKRPLSYVFSFYGVVDLISFIPTYLSVIVPGAQSLIVIRVFRLLRLFRVFKLVRLTLESDYLARAVRASLPKVFVFLLTIFFVTVFVGAMMTVVEPDNPGFSTIPAGIYWAIVTIATVGYGDIVPLTALGKMIASILIITGYGIIAVPTGLVTAELITAERRRKTNCDCGAENDLAARYCNRCGKHLLPATV